MKTTYLLAKTIIAFVLYVNINIYSQSGPLDGRGGGIIAFISDRDGTSEIYLMNADGSYQTKVTNNDAVNFGLSWSRDGKRLAFCSTLDTGFEIYIMDVIDITTASFSEPLRITNNTVMDFNPTWSPDGLKIAFDSQLDGNPGIVIMNLDDGSIEPLNTSSVSGDQPSWSPVENRIAFASAQGIYTITTSGTDLQHVTSGYAVVPEYSPDGSQIAYVATYAAEDIFIVNSDGTDNHRITTSVENDFVPSWSPNCNRLVYEGTVAGIDQICVMDTDGTNYQQLTDIGTNTGPSWYPILEPISVNNDISKNKLNDFRLHQNYPNPFNPRTLIELEIPEESINSLKIFDITGREIQILLNDEILAAGTHKYYFNAVNLPSGVYVYIFRSNSFVSNKIFNGIKKMVLLK